MPLFAKFLVFIWLVVSVDVECQEIAGFAKPLSVLMSTRNAMARKMKFIANNVDNPKLLKNYIQILKDLKQHTKAFIEAPLTTSESLSSLEMLKVMITQDRSFTDEEALYKSYSLKKDKKERLGMLLNRLTININQFISSGKPSHMIPLSNVCKGLPLSSINSLTNDSTKEITIRDICGGLFSCASVPRPYHWMKFDGGSHAGVRKGLPWFPEVGGGGGGGWGGGGGRGGLRLPFFTDAPTTPKPKPTPDPRFEQNALTACTTNKQCKVEKALPMMTGIFWYKLSEMIVQRLCSEGCAGEQHNYAELYRIVMEETDMLISYATTLPNNWNSIWNPFFQNAAAKDAFVNLDVALTIVNEKKQDFEGVGNLCYSFQFAKACPISDLYNQYTLIKQIQKQRTQATTVKDLRLLPQVDHSKMIELQNDELKQLQLLGSIKKLDENLQSSVAGISKYFEDLSTYDQGIAAADVAFIKGELTRYETSLATVEAQINKDLKEAMNSMKKVLAANLAEQIAILAAVLLANSNPLKLAFSGPDIKDMMEQSGKVADAASQVKYGLALINALKDLTDDSMELQKAFIGNKNQITSLQKVVEKIKNGQASNIGKDGDLFIQEYGAYTPQTDRSRLAHNDALWLAYKDSTCDLLNGEVGVGGAVVKAIAGGTLICERLDGALAQFITLREDIFDFQFQLVDAIASVVRGNIAQRLAKNIKGKHESLHASLLMTGFFMAQNKIQSVSSVYCNRIEYQELGTPFNDCSTTDGLFRKKNIVGLIKYKDNKAYDKITRDVYIPTKATYAKFNNSFLDLYALARGEKVVFKIPSDTKWLQDHGWILPGEETIPFVESFKLFLPQREYKTGADIQHTTTKVTVSSIAGSSVSSKTSVVYLLPRDQTIYRTVYEEGYRACDTEIQNPHSLCNNLPKICDKIQRSPGSSLLPTVVSVWSVQQAVYQGSTELTWDAPSSATNLLLHAKVVLKMPAKTKRFKIPRGGLRRSDIVRTEDGCCKTGNRYRISLYNRKCAVCPAKTTSLLGGLFCQINLEKTEMM